MNETESAVRTMLPHGSTTVSLACPKTSLFLRSDSSLYQNLDELFADDTALGSDQSAILVRTSSSDPEEPLRVAALLTHVAGSLMESPVGDASARIDSHVSFETLRDAYDTIMYVMYHEDIILRRLVLMVANTICVSGLTSRIVRDVIKSRAAADTETLVGYFKAVHPDSEMSAVLETFLARGAEKTATLTIGLANQILQAVRNTVPETLVRQRADAISKLVMENAESISACLMTDENESASVKEIGCFTHGPVFEAIHTERLTLFRTIAEARQRVHERQGALENCELNRRFGSGAARETLHEHVTEEYSLARLKRLWGTKNRLETRLKDAEAALSASEAAYARFFRAGLATFRDIANPDAWSCFFTRSEKLRVMTHILQDVPDGALMMHFGRTAVSNWYTKLTDQWTVSDGCLEMSCEALTANGKPCTTTIYPVTPLGVACIVPNAARDFRLVDVADPDARTVTVCQQPVEYVSTTNKRRRTEQTSMFESLAMVAADTYPDKRFKIIRLCNTHAKSRDTVGGRAFSSITEPAAIVTHCNAFS